MRRVLATRTTTRPRPFQPTGRTRDVPCAPPCPEPRRAPRTVARAASRVGLSVGVGEGEREGTTERPDADTSGQKSQFPSPSTYPTKRRGRPQPCRPHPAGRSSGSLTSLAPSHPPASCGEQWLLQGHVPRLQRRDRARLSARRAAEHELPCWPLTGTHRTSELWRYLSANAGECQAAAWRMGADTAPWRRWGSRPRSRCSGLRPSAPRT